MTETVSPESLQPDASLLGRVVRGGAWMTTGEGAARLLPMLRNIVLLRFLDPTQFGLWWAISSVVVGAQVFTDTGVTAAVIQKPQGTRAEYLSTAWLIQALRGVVLAALTLVVAPGAAWFFDNEELVRPLQLMAVLFLVGGLASPKVLLFTRDLDFKKLVILQQLSAVASLVVALVLGIAWRNVWALVLAEIVREVVFVGAGYAVAPFRPTLKFFDHVVRELWQFGKHVYLANVCLFLLLQGDYLVVGRMLGVGPLGNYRFGWHLAHLPGMTAGAMVGRVSFPAYARMQDNRSRLAGAYLRVLGLTACYAWPAAVGLAFLAPVIPQYGGEKWASAVTPMQIMCVAGLVQALNATGGSLFLGTGRPDLLSRVALFNLLLMGVLIFPLTYFFGIVGTAWSIVLSQVPTAVVVLEVVRRQLKMRWGEILRVSVAPVPATAGMTLMLLGLWLLKLDWRIYTVLAVAAGVVVYGVLLYLTADRQIRQFRHAMQEGLRPEDADKGEDNHPGL